MRILRTAPAIFGLETLPKILLIVHFKSKGHLKYCLVLSHCINSNLAMVLQTMFHVFLDG